MAASAEGTHESTSTRICVFVPIRRWRLQQWASVAIGLIVGGAALAAIVYSTWVGVRTLRVEIAIAVFAIVPWWWLFGGGWWWLLKSIRRGGHPLVLLVSERGMALGMNDEGTLVRVFDGPSLTETDAELIIENGAFYMVARLPKDQVSPEHADLIRRCVHSQRVASG